MTSRINRISLVPQNVQVVDLNISSSVYSTVYPPYQNISSGSYLAYINGNSDVFLRTTDRGNILTTNYSYSTVAYALLGSSNTNFMYQNTGDFTYLQLVTRFQPFSGSINAVAWNGSIWVAAGAGNVAIATSLDGLSWVPRTNVFGSGAFSVVWNPVNSTWLVAGSNTTYNSPIMAISADNGFSWTSINAYVHNLNDIPGRPVWINTFSLLVVGNLNRASFITSSNAIHWNYLGTIGVLHGAWNGNMLIVVNNSQNLYFTSSRNLTSNWGTLYDIGLGAGTTVFRAIAYSPTLGIWNVAGSNSSAVANPLIYYSYNGFNWLPATGVTALSYFNDIIWDGTQFVAVGASNAGFGCYSSTDGVTFTQRAPFIFGTAATGIVYSPSLNLYVASGFDLASYNQIAYSSNLIDWTSSGNVFGVRANCVGWSSELSMFVAGGERSGADGASLAYSYNGSNWTAIPTTNLESFSRCEGILYVSELGLWVATGYTSNTVLTSPDGVNWNVSPTNTGVLFRGNGLAFSSDQNRYVLVGIGGYSISVSGNGVTWRGITGTTIFSTQGNAVIWVSALYLWIALGQGTNTIATSIDGITWQGRGASVFTTAGFGIAWNGSLLVAVGSGTNTIATSINGLNWTGRGITVFTASGRSVVWNSSRSLWVAVGDGTNTIATSPDGITWTGRGTTTFTTQGTGIAFSREQNQMIASATSGGINRLASSVNGIVWDNFQTVNSLSDSIFSIVWNGTIWVAGGGGANSIVTSPDGISWTGRGSPVSVASNVAWNGSLWVACGSGGTNRVATSPDGITWTGRGLVGHASNTSVIWYPFRSFWIMTGTTANAIFTSPDGITWTSRTTNTMGSNRAIAYNTSGLLALGGIAGAGTNILQTSFDGITWTNRISTTTLTNTINSIAFSPSLNLWAAVGSNKVFTSSNGTTWNVNNSPFTSGLFISWNNNYFVATGQNTSIDSSFTRYMATSADGITWRASSNPNIISDLVTVGIRNPIMVAGGEGTNTICTSFDNGLTWQPRFTGGGRMNVISWNGNIWVAGDVNGGIYTSPDAINWTSRTSPFTSTINTILWAESLKTWVLGGCYPWTFATSTDGISWTGRVSTTLIFNSCLAMDWNGSNRFIALGNGSNSVALSSNGIGWNSFSYLVQIPTRYANIAWNGNVFVALTDTQGYFSITVDGNTSFSNVLTTSSTLNTNMKVRWNGRQFLAIGSPSGAIFTSSNGSNWVQSNISLPLSSVTNTLTWNTNTSQWFIGGVDTSVNRNFIASSPDGINWTTRMNYPNMSNVTGFTWASTINIWVGTGSSNANIVTSPDGTVWTQRLDNQLGTAFGVAWNGSLFVAVGGNTSQFFTSSNGITWTNRTNGGVAAFSVVNGITWATSLNLWVATGENSGATQGIIATSTDGINWTSRNTDIFTTRANHVAWNGSLFVVVGQGTNVFATSADGITWTARGSTGITTAGRGVTWATSPGQTSLWVAVGSGTNSIATSPDGVTWTGRTTTSIFSVQGNEVANNGSVTVAVGEGTNTYAWSYDNGVNWTAGGTSVFNTAGTTLAWSPTTGQWVGGSSNLPFFLNSPDGINWNRGITFTSSVQVLAVQSREKIFTVTNSNWTGATSQQTFRFIT